MNICRIKKITRLFVAIALVLTAGLSNADEEFKVNPNNLPICEGEDYTRWINCFSIEITKGKGKVESVKDNNGKMHGWVAIYYPNGEKVLVKFIHGKDTGNIYRIYPNGSKYVGQTKDGKYHGKGTLTLANGKNQQGLWENGKFISKEKNINTEAALNFLDISTIKKIEGKINPNHLSICKGDDSRKWNNCWGLEDLYGILYVGEFQNGKYNGYGSWKLNIGINYLGEFKDNLPNGFGIYELSSEEKYVGYLKNDSYNGAGIYVFKDGTYHAGEWENGAFIKSSDINSSYLKELKIFLDYKKIKITQHKITKKIHLYTENTQPNLDGDFNITIQTNADTASLKINGEELGGRVDGNYNIKKVARIGQESQFTIIATDTNGNTDTKTITVSRPITESLAKFATLNPAKLKKQPERDAVAIIIGIADYKNLPRADFANDDASVFYDYAIRALGIKSENVKLLVDSSADEVAIYQAFKTWLPSRVRSTTDVYIYYSGHGLPSEDGQSLYLLPQRAHRDLIEKTAISQREINGYIQAAKPKSVTIFLDSCYSGLTRTGEALITSARPITLKVEKKIFPEEFTVISASQADQISSSSPDLKHGIFSYYLMRGMEGEADVNRDGKITTGEMHSYLAEQVNRQAGMINRKQEPQLVGDANRVLVGR